jgi:DNA-binding MarR family transcriptional regulator
MRLQLIPALHRATHRVAVYLQRIPGLGITQAEAHLLAHLVEHGASHIGALHAAFGHRRSTLTSILDRMETRGLVLRQTDRKDRRSFLVKLTPEGRRKGKYARRVLLACETEMRAACSQEQIAGFLVVAEALASAGGERTLKAGAPAGKRRKEARNSKQREGKR